MLLGATDLNAIPPSSPPATKQLATDNREQTQDVAALDAHDDPETAIDADVDMVAEADAEAAQIRLEGGEELEDQAGPDAVDELLNKARIAGDVGLIFDSVAILADLSPARWANVRNTIKENFGTKINLNDLQKVVKEAKRKLFCERRYEYKRFLPQICVNGRPLRDITDDSLRALSAGNDPPEIFVRGCELVRLKRDDKDRPNILAVDESFIRGRLARRADFFAVSAQGEEKIVHPPIAVVKDIHALDINAELARLNTTPVPGLDSIVESPVLRPDGTILVKPGYDSATRLFFPPTPTFLESGFQIPENPTPGEIKAAVGAIEEVICDFPFEDPASKANAFAAMITPFIRPLLIGKVPMALFDKPEPGTGGSLLAESIITVATGRDVAMRGAPCNEEEWRKVITTILAAGEPIALIDNAEQVLEADSLARVITASEWGDRALGFNKDIRLPARTTWFCTGNNIQLGRNMARRCYFIRINAKVADPEMRPESQFKHPNLIEWIIEDRGRIVAAVLTLCRAWYVAGKPRGQHPILGSFENWSKTVGGIMALAGIPGFLGNLKEMRAAADEEKPQWEAFLLALEETYGQTNFKIGQIEDDITRNARLREALPPEFGRLVEREPARGFTGEMYRVDRNFKIRMGKALKKRAGMRFGEGIHIVKGTDDSHTKVARWRVVRPETAGSAGSCGECLSSTHEEDTYLKGRYSAMEHGDKILTSLHAPPARQSDLSELSNDELEAFNERVAVLEIDGGHDAATARDMALAEIERKSR